MVQVDPKEIEQFYMEAVPATYAGDLPKTTISELPKSKVYRYERGDFLYVDCYFSSGRHSAGQITIWYKGTPVWVMQYYGFWDHTDDRIIPFLKRALLAAKEFIGGRGPREYVEDGLKYENIPLVNNFRLFEGNEYIFDTNDHNRNIFFHKYSGIML